MTPMQKHLEWLKTRIVITKEIEEKLLNEEKDNIFFVAYTFHRLGKYEGYSSDTHFQDIYEKTISEINPTII